MINSESLNRISPEARVVIEMIEKEFDQLSGTVREQDKEIFALKTTLASRNETCEMQRLQIVALKERKQQLMMTLEMLRTCALNHFPAINSCSCLSAIESVQTQQRL